LRRGGIASLPRQGYFVGDIVGGIGDVLGGAAKKAKEIVKSDAGKAALALAGLYATRNMGPIGEAGGWKKFLLGAPGVGGPAHGAREGLLGKWGLTKGFGGGITGLGMGAAAGVGTAALMAGAPKPPKDQLDLMRQRGEDIEPYLRDWYKKYYTANWQEGWTQEGEDEFVRVNTSEYNKGGRVGYARGPEEPFLLDEDIPELGEDINLQELIKEEGIPIGEQVKGPLLPELEEEDIMEFMQDQGIQTKELEAGAADIKVTGDVTPDIEKFIKEKWIERGGEWGDLIPKWFRDEIIKYYNLRASAPHPDENWMGLWEDLRGKGEVPESIRNLQEFKNWFHNQDFDIDMSQVDTGIMQASKGGRAGMQQGGRGLLSLSHLPWLRLLEEEEEKAKGGRIGLKQGTPKWTEEFRKLGLEGGSTKEFRKLFKKMKKKSKSKAVKITKAQGGRINQLYGTGPVGLPGIPRMAADGLEYDMRGGGFQNLGAKEGKDDVKANLAKNEFVMTADAVRGAGGGDIEVGAQRMYDTMKKLERKIA